MKVFYSWQTDAPRTINKDFIYHALGKAVERIGEELDLSEAERDGIELDQDTQGVLGSPEIARVIFDKIAAARVIVSDVSLVAKGTNDKPHINSNVAIELGYAYGKVGDGTVLKVMNTYFGTPDNLPFDLRIRRRPVQYDLPPNADAAMIAAEQKKLVSQFSKILKLYIEDRSSNTVSDHTEMASVGLRGCYWKPNEVLVPKDRYSEELYGQRQSILYFRCIPQKALPELSALEASDLSGDFRPLFSMIGYSKKRNKLGVISYAVHRDKNTLVGATQLFRNRELWGIDLGYSEIYHQPEDEDEDPIKYLPTGAINREYPRAIDSIRGLASKLGYGDSYSIEMGYSGAEGLHLAVSKNYFDPFPGPIYETEVYVRKSIRSDYPTGEIMNDFWRKMFSEIGETVPDKLIWAP